MPKGGHPPSYWEGRLKSYALGLSVFTTGQAPRKGTVYAEKLVLIKECHLQNNAGGKSVFGVPFKCNCGYHQSTVFLFQILVFYIQCCCFKTFQKLIQSHIYKYVK